MCNCDYLKKVAATLVGAMIGVPCVAGGFYTLYLIVTTLGN